MGHNGSKKGSDGPDDPDEQVDGGGAAIGLALPIRDAGLFKHGATEQVLNFLGDNPDIDVSIRQLSRVVPMSERATREAVDTLERNELLRTFHRGNARRVHINRERLHRPDDPVLSIPQTEYQTPVRVASHSLLDELEQVAGIVLFGSVARGEADRTSDIDLWVLVRDDLLEQRHRANDLATRLQDLRIPPTVALAEARDADFERTWAGFRDRIEGDEGDRSTGQRYSFEIVVESPRSIVAQSSRVDPEKLFGEGITLHSTETLERVTMEILNDE